MLAVHGCDVAKFVSTVCIVRILVHMEVTWTELCTIENGEGLDGFLVVLAAFFVSSAHELKVTADPRQHMIAVSRDRHAHAHVLLTDLGTILF